MSHANEFNEQVRSDEPLLSCLLAVSRAFGETDEDRVIRAWKSVSSGDDLDRMQAAAKLLRWARQTPESGTRRAPSITDSYVG